MRERDADGALHRVTFDGGPHGALTCGHAHADALGITVAIGGVPVVVDPGTGAYVGAARDRYRATRMHATVTVDALDSSEQGTAFRWRTVASTRLGGASIEGDAAWACASHDGYARLADPVRHRRILIRLPRRYWIMLDTLTCAAPHDVTVMFPLAPDARAQAGHAGRMRVTAGAATLLLAVDGGRTVRVAPSTVAPTYGTELPSTRLVIDARIDAPTTLGTVFGDVRESGELAVEALGPAAWAVQHAGGRDVVLLGVDAPVAHDGIAFDGTWCALLDDTGDGARRLVAAGMGTLHAGNARVAVGESAIALRREAGAWQLEER